MKNRSEARKINHRDFPRSFGFKPGAINRHSSNKTYGNERINPRINDVQIAIVNCPVTSVLINRTFA